MYGSSVTEYSLSYVENFKNLRVLDLGNNDLLTPKCFTYFKKVNRLSLKYCCNLPLSSFKEGILELNELVELNLEGCENLVDDVFSSFKMVKKLNLSYCINVDLFYSRSQSFVTFTDKAFESLENLVELEMISCYSPGYITDNAFKYLKNLKILNISRCMQLTDNAFKYLGKIESLIMQNCRQSSITDHAFTYLKNLKVLDIFQCSQESLTPLTITHIQKTIEVLDIRYSGVSDRMQQDELMLILIECRDFYNLKELYYESFDGECVSKL